MKSLMSSLAILMTSCLLTALNQSAGFVQTQLSAPRMKGGYVIVTVLVIALATWSLAKGLACLLRAGQPKATLLDLSAAVLACSSLPLLLAVNLQRDSEFTTQIFTLLYASRGYM